jgi:hypothetical protein
MADSVDELAAQLEALLKANEQLALENKMFESFLQRNTTDFRGPVMEEEKKGRKGIAAKRRGEILSCIFIVA